MTILNYRHLSNQLMNIYKRLRQQFPYLPQTFELIKKASGWWFAAWALLLFISGCLPAATAFLTRSIVNRLMTLIENNGAWTALFPFIISAALMAAVIVLAEIVQRCVRYVRTVQAERVKDYIHGRIHLQALSLPLDFFDSSEYYDMLHRARIDAINQPVALIENIGALTQNGITLVAMLIILAGFSWWLPLLLLIGTFPAFIVVIVHTTRFHQWRNQTTAQVRRSHYYDWIMTQRETAAEIRMFNLGRHFQSSFQQVRSALRNGLIELTRKQAVAELFAIGFSLVTFLAAMGWMLIQVISASVSMGDLAMFYQIFYQGQRIMRTLLGNAGEVYRNIAFIENLFQFLSLSPAAPEAGADIDLPASIRTGIRFENVTFSYPRSRRSALSDFSIFIPAGKMTAVVGTNGAGKSTFIKLICRLYDPQNGNIFIDDINLRQVLPQQLHQRITVLFQEPVHYHATAAENIRMGNLNGNFSSDNIISSARAAGADQLIKRLPDGYDTLLGHWFGGTELSRGEWQRVALARAFFRKSDVIILDEPTSFMDSWAEADWLGRFRKQSTGAVSVVITHRFTTAMQADIIYVMDKGSIIESGSHRQLMAADGFYAASWKNQIRDRY